jgi:hypothetical protein
MPTVNHPMRVDRFCFVAFGIAAIAVAYACGGGDSAADPASADGGGASSSSGGTGGSSGTSGSSGSTSSGGNSDGAVTGPGCGQAACTGVAGMCGTIIDACGQKVTCEACRWTSDPTNASNVEHVAIAATGPGAFVIATVSDGIVSFGTKGAGGWQLARVAPDVEAGAFDNVLDLHMALAPDGTPWIVFAHGSSSYTISVAHRTGGTWSVESLGYGIDAAIAVAADGTPTVAYIGSVTGQAGGGYGAVAARRASGGGWTARTLVSQSNLVRDIAVAVTGTEARVAWYDATALAVRYGFGVPGAASFTNEDIKTGVSSSGTEIHVDITNDAAGKPVVAYLPYNAGPNYAVRDAGVWTIEPATGLGAYRGPVRIANAPNDAMVMAVLDRSGDTLRAGFRRQAAWSAQTLFRNCMSGSVMDMAVDGAGTAAIVHSCKAGGLEVWMQSGIFPAGYSAACASLGKGLCDPACACPRADDGKCCIYGNGGTSSLCTGPASFCPTSWGERYCGNVTLDPMHVFACQAALPSVMCSADGGVGAVEPVACAPLRQ